MYYITKLLLYIFLGFIPASQLLEQDQFSLQMRSSLQEDCETTKGLSKIPQIKIGNINIQNCNNVKVEVHIKSLD
jgi:hypothetical protein